MTYHISCVDRSTFIAERSSADVSLTWVTAGNGELQVAAVGISTYLGRAVYQTYRYNYLFRPREQPADAPPLGTPLL